MRSKLKQAARWMALSWVCWTVLIAISAGQMYLSLASRNYPLALRTAMFLQPPVWYFWWLASPLIFWLGNRFSFQSGQRSRDGMVHLGAAAVLALFPFMIWTVSRHLTADLPLWAGLWREYRSGLGMRYAFDMVTYVAVLAVCLGIGLLRRARANDMRAANLEIELERSRLQALTAQLHPHFLFNALNGVAMLIRGQAYSRALQTLTGYSDLMRAVLSSEGDVTLRQEVEVLSKYLDIQKMRFPETLSTSIDVSPAVGEALVPSLILQPVVENAVLYGCRDGAPTHVTISARRDNGRAIVTVSDNGPGLAKDWDIDTHAGVGLRNLRDRLRHRYGPDHQLELSSPLGRGTVVRIVVPFCRGGESPQLAYRDSRL